MAERYERLFSSYDKYYAEDAPAVIVAEALLKDTKKERVVAQLKFQNIVPKSIQAVNIGIKAFDSFGKELQGIDEYQYTDLHVGIGKYWGQETAIDMPNILTRTIEVVIKSIIFSDGSVWENPHSVWIKLAKPLNLYTVLKSEELVKQYKIEYGNSAQSFYLEENGVWHCVCGTINKADSAICYYCKLTKEKLAAYNFDVLKTNADARIAEEKAKAEEKARLEKEAAEKEAAEEAERIEKEKQARKERKQKAIKTGIGILAVCMVLGLSYGGFRLTTEVIIPLVKYNKATNLQAKGEYSRALTIFDGLGNYSDSPEKLLECKYGYALDLKSVGEYEAAISVFEEIIDYSDSEEQISECNYLNALKLIEEKEYEQGYSILESLGDYSDADFQLKNSKYQRAVVEKENKNYEIAVNLLSETSDFEDSNELIIECRYFLAKQCMEEERYSDAVDLLTELRKTEYKDTKALLDEASYLLAKEYLSKKEYKKAKTLFNNVKTVYPDAKDLYVQAVYGSAGEYFEEDYESAVACYNIIKGYEDSEQKRIEANYYWALQLIEKREYIQAVNKLEEISSFMDVESELNEAKYAFVKLHRDYDNMITYKYLKALKEIGYADSAEIYDKLYQWKAKVVINSSESDTTKKTSIRATDPLYVHITVSGGEPGETTKVKYKYEKPAGETGQDSFDWEFGRDYSSYVYWENGLYKSSSYRNRGEFSIVFYDGKGNEIGKGSVEIE